MKTISIKNDIVPIAEFKTKLAQWFKSLQNTGHPLIITQNGKPAGVLLSPDDYDELVYNKAFLDSVGRGIADADSGKTFSTKELRAALTSRRTRE
jgi:prevent-host-death family protein